MADSHLEEKKRKLEKFRKRLVSLSVNDSNHYRQLKAEFNKLSTLPKHIKFGKNNFSSRSSHQELNEFNKQRHVTQSILNKLIFKIHKQNYSNNYNSDFNYLYNEDENLNGTEFYIYDLKTHTRTSTNELKSYKPNHRLLDKIENIIKVSDSYLIIMGKFGYDYKTYLMDLKTKEISEIHIFDSLRHAFDKHNQFIYYGNYIYLFGCSGLEKYDINLKKWHRLQFPDMRKRAFAVLFQNYVLVTSYPNSKLYLYDLLIESYSDITFSDIPGNRKFLFTDQERVYLWILENNIYESDINNPFKWNIIGNTDFGIEDEPYDITFSYFEGNIYASYLERPLMSCYKFNKERKEMELIYEEQVNR